MKYVRKDKFTKPVTPAEVLELALEKEKSSYEFYVEMIKKTENPFMKKLLEELKNAEWGHIQIIQHKMKG
ncbi:MAG: ferritin family protein [Candidatus Omnitrophota bacterium]|nr:ferritin family protein [Candidatus Omnitrophota bacterium]